MPFSQTAGQGAAAALDLANATQIMTTTGFSLNKIANDTVQSGVAMVAAIGQGWNAVLAQIMALRNQIQPSVAGALGTNATQFRG